MRELLIVGIDPGTTTAYAVFGLDGRFIVARSAKEFDLNDVVRELIGIGEPVVIGTDRTKSPEFVLKLATKLGCRLVNPSYDLKVGEKVAMTRHLKLRNDHERDSAASALFAFRECRPLLEKADRIMQEDGKLELAREVKRLVLLDDHMSIRSAIEVAGYVEEEKAEPERREKILVNDELVFLRSELKKHTLANISLKLQNHVLTARNQRLLERLKGLINSAKSGGFDMRLAQLLKFREARLSRFSSKLGSLQKELEAAKHEKQLIMSAFLSQDHYLAKRLKDLDSHEAVTKAKSLRIAKNDLLIVDDANLISKEGRELLRGKVMIFLKPLLGHIRKSMPCLLVDAAELDIQLHEDFALVNRRSLDAAKKKSDIISHVVSSYRSERGN